MQAEPQSNKANSLSPYLARQSYFAKQSSFAKQSYFAKPSSFAKISTAQSAEVIHG